MVKIDRLPSGTYRARVHLGGGKYKTLTDKNEKELEKKLKTYNAKLTLGLVETTPPPSTEMTVAEAMDKYIASKNNILSPSTVRGYQAIRDNMLKCLINVKLHELTQEIVQNEINEESEDKSPKYVRNAHGFLSAVLKQYRPDFVLHTTLPKNKKVDIKIPTEDEMQKLFTHIAGTEIELPVLLGACCGLRRSEVLGLKWSDIDFAHDTMSINEAKVLNSKNVAVSKGTKTMASTRTIRIYPFIRTVLENCQMTNGEKYVISMQGYQVYNYYSTALEKAGVRHYRFHDLRHYLVSVMLSLNIPKKYIADYVGHETENMIDQVYGHIMAQKKTSTEDLLQEYFEKSVMKSVTI